MPAAGPDPRATTVNTVFMAPIAFRDAPGAVCLATATVFATWASLATARASARMMLNSAASANLTVRRASRPTMDKSATSRAPRSREWYAMGGASAMKASVGRESAFATGRRTKASGTARCARSARLAGGVKRAHNSARAFLRLARRALATVCVTQALREPVFVRATRGICSPTVAPAVREVLSPGLFATTTAPASR